MKNFLTITLGSFLGSLIALFAFSVISIIFTFIGFAGLAASFENTPKTEIKPHSVLKIDLDRPIVEKQSVEDEFNTLIDKSAPAYILSDLMYAIKEAATDENIEGIYLKCSGSSVGAASSLELRNQLLKFKESGKWIYAYGDYYTQGDYYLASVASNLYINPEGVLDLSGLVSSTPYFKKLLDKLGVEMQIFKVGTFKSAVEPYILNESSEANKLQTETFLASMWDTISADICNEKGIEQKRFNEMIDSLVALKPTEYLVQNKLVDGTCYEFDFMDKLREQLDLEENEDIPFVAPSHFNTTIISNSIVLSEDSISTVVDYIQSVETSKDKIAVLYAIGEINSSSEDGIVAATMCEEIINATYDDDIKGLVMRVNSPGGSAFDSEQIWAALEKFKKSGKPFAVSMGDYAASGGYYISCGADYIFAEPTTLTGSIGIFGMVPNLNGLVTDLGVNFSTVTTNKNTEMSILKPLNSYQSLQMQQMVNRGYELFTNRCAIGRNMNIDELKKIAEGRVWDGKSALHLGLIDELGALQDAIHWVAKSAKIDSFQIVKVPQPEDFLTRFMNRYASEVSSILFKSQLDYILDYKTEINNIILRDPIQARTELNVKL